MNDLKCHGHRRSGYWKGYPCGAWPVFKTEDGKTWCRNHLPVGEKAVVSQFEFDRHGSM